MDYYYWYCLTKVTFVTGIPTRSFVTDISTLATYGMLRWGQRKEVPSQFESRGNILSKTGHTDEATAEAMPQGNDTALHFPLLITIRPMDTHASDPIEIAFFLYRNAYFPAEINFVGATGGYNIRPHLGGLQGFDEVICQRYCKKRIWTRFIGRKEPVILTCFSEEFDCDIFFSHSLCMGILVVSKIEGCKLHLRSGLTCAFVNHLLNQN